MPSHLSTIGIPLESEQAFYQLIDEAAQQAKEIPCSAGQVLKWSSPDGAELWLYVDTNQDLVGVTPSFCARSRFKVNITQEVSPPPGSRFEGLLYAWANPQNDEPESGDYPFVFEFVNKALREQLTLPLVCEIELSAFAHELNVFDSEAAFHEAQKESATPMAAESFIPSGLFGDENAAPEAYGVFTGTVLAHDILTNGLTGTNYGWASVKTLGGTIDVLFDPVLLDKPITTGGILSGSFWLNGKVLADAVKPSNSIWSTPFKQ